MTARGDTLVVAARSARLLAEAATREGFRVVALDVFGDLDTRRAAHEWQSIASDAAHGVPAIDGAKLVAALAAHRNALGWIAGSDLDGRPDVLQAGAGALRLIGSTPADVRRVRDPRGFFGLLEQLGLAHPETAFEPPSHHGGWLRKHADGCGGWHIRRAAAADASPAATAYFQREAPGTPMSALFVAALVGPGALRHRLVGINRLIVRAFGAHPYVYRGAIGPVGLPAAAMRALREAIDALVEAFALRGLASLDFLWHDGRASLLEINPRPSASMALYAAEPLMRWHLQACGLAAHEAPDVAAVPDAGVAGIETVFARRAFTLTGEQAGALATRADACDLPAAGSRFEAGDPVCSLAARDANAAAVQRTLTARRQALRAWLAA
ncbi:MAG TPA: ATP-grasp domain-containing protein [Methylibium sp.]|uniref:ATP-grasp domain-containing protein n=1 Tax=Methylibium sp. TaxID=2067992 RepID=UPI002DBFC2FE|nr:ATP-grasp domain-containing protein [Methylibium sp.]HEU4459810.1 ATP-grasp domain-containing protein [Methylibium sp.]